MRVNPIDMYEQKMYEISTRVNNRLSAIRMPQMSQSFSEVMRSAEERADSTYETQTAPVNAGTVSLNSEVGAKRSTGKNSAAAALALSAVGMGGIFSDSMSAENYLYSLYGGTSSLFAGSKAYSFTSKYDGIISEKAQMYGIDKNIIRAVIQAESDFNPNCVSKAGAKGLMQLMPCNVSDLGIKNVFDPEENIDGGVRELKGYLEAFGGDLKIALAAYNCGPTRVRNLGITDLDDSAQFAKLPKETRNYITKIINNLK